jgi:two-component system, OmpR family, sensor histidine kinase MtrB
MAIALAPPSRARRHIGRWRLPNLRLQLLPRLTTAFALGALVLCIAVAGTAYFSARSTIEGQAVAADESTASIDAGQLQLVPTSFIPSDILPKLSSIDTSDNSLSLYEFGPPGCSATDSCSWIDASPFTASQARSAFSNLDLPKSLIALVTGGKPGFQVFSFAGEAYIGVGYPVNGDAFFQVFPTAVVSKTLQDLVLALLFATVVTVLGGAVLGRWAARRVLRPLHEATLAASAIANGEFDTRLETDGTSDLAALAAAFNQMVDGVQARIEREARFASDVAHELRSPLTTLANSAAVLDSRRDELPERSQQALDLLTGEIHRFQRMVFDLLEISRLDAGVSNLSLAIVTTGELVRNTLASAGASEVPLVMDPDSAVTYLNVDKRRFERIMTNLIANAERHGGGASRVEVTSDDEAVHVAVEDAGPGVSAEDQHRIFDRFARGAATAGTRGRGSGTGLGLALVAEHVKLLNGTVTVEEAKGGGARFVVSLPLAPADLVSDDEEAEDSP